MNYYTLHFIYFNFTLLAQDNCAEFERNIRSKLFRTINFIAKFQYYLSS